MLSTESYLDTVNCNFKCRALKDLDRMSLSRRACRGPREDAVGTVFKGLAAQGSNINSVLGV